MTRRGRRRPRGEPGQGPARIARELLAAIAVALPLAAVAPPAHGELPTWSGRSTEESAERLKNASMSLSSVFLDQATAYPVEDVRWTHDGLELHFVRGLVYLETSSDDRPAGAYFVGEGTMTVRATDPVTTEAISYWFGGPVTAEPIRHAYVLSNRGPITEALGLQPAEPDAAPDVAPDVEPYVRYKRVLRHAGLRGVQALLNRDNRARDQVFVVVSPPAFAVKGSEDATLMYSVDLNRELDLRLDAIGHEALSRNSDYRGYLYPLIRWSSGGQAFIPQADVSDSEIRLDLTGSLNDVSVTTRIEFTPPGPIRAVLLEMGPLSVISRVTGGDGEAIPFLQWRFDPESPNLDWHALLDFGEPLEPGTPRAVTIEARGDLFTAVPQGFNPVDLANLVTGSVWGLRDEDTWYPQIRDVDGFRAAIDALVDRNMTAVAAGELIHDEEEGKARRMSYRTKRPVRRATFYVGDYRVKSGRADETEISVFMDRTNTSDRDHRATVAEMENIVKVFNRILDDPLEEGQLRVASTPTGHGRGFEQLLLLSQYGGFGGIGGRRGTGADVFRAHEVAHQWFGNRVDVLRWPRDRWIMESLADYVALEYFRLRFEDPRQTRREIREQWIDPIENDEPDPHLNLRGEWSKVRHVSGRPLAAGGQIVYTKGPWVVHTLRYLFTASKGSDAGFWTLIQDFLREHRGGRASTDDFFALAERHLGMKLDWFVDQWFHGTAIPEVRWSHSVEPSGTEWTVTIDVQDDGSGYFLVIPAYIQLENGKVAMKPVVVKGGSGQAVVKVPAAVKSVSLNEFHDTIVRIDD